MACPGVEDALTGWTLDLLGHLVVQILDYQLQPNATKYHIPQGNNAVSKTCNDKVVYSEVVHLHTYVVYCSIKLYSIE